MQLSSSRNSSANELGLIGESQPFLQVIESIKQVAPTNITVLITGESGTGKEMVAKAIHRLSSRKDKPLLSVNCGAIPEGILESELFGHEKGSFTGATETRKGYFEAADGGTLFLDEIGEMPLSTQVKLLRVLEEKAFMRVGGTKQIHVDVRLLAATNKNLGLDVEKNLFRRDLFYRLNTVNITVPPLRQRKADIRPLVLQFTEDVSKENNILFQGFTPDAFQYLENQTWPGNIRELRNLIERILILEKGQKIDRAKLEKHMGVSGVSERNLPVVLHKSTDQAERELIYRALLDIRMSVEELKNIIMNSGLAYSNAGQDGVSQFQQPKSSNIAEEENTLKEIEKKEIERALRRYRGNRRKVSKVLGIGERTLYRKLKEYGFEDIF